ncbi:hypothetical protein B0T10DRAFT_43962 [Thelonectria olida]|uniref:Uncharacterized protein n=1 Tax=Thelonectria olida TaxID=1576542 RepID=A0A9P9APQ5_9HYPO|nr:hypothetical protein B0T10DRAFT_77823 [Thelonectria olida]KAH6889967.1 hypothetical protein B0T10DRAFT_43962 [Thelonectria olida]
MVVHSFSCTSKGKGLYTCQMDCLRRAQHSLITTAMRTSFVSRMCLWTRTTSWFISSTQAHTSATSVRVFSMARVYRLPTLRHLATREIQRLGDGLGLPCIVDVLQDVHSNLCDEDEWLETYLASRTRSELNTLDKPRA